VKDIDIKEDGKYDQLEEDPLKTAHVHNVVLSNIKRAHSVGPEFEIERFTIPTRNVKNKI